MAFRVGFDRGPSAEHVCHEAAGKRRSQLWANFVRQSARDVGLDLHQAGENLIVGFTGKKQRQIAGCPHDGRRFAELNRIPLAIAGRPAVPNLRPRDLDMPVAIVRAGQ